MWELACFNYAHHPKGAGPQHFPKLLGPPTCAHTVSKKSYQILHCDQTGCEKFSAVAKILATRMLTCDLFAVANLLVAVWRGTQYRAFTPPANLAHKLADLAIATETQLKFILPLRVP